MAKYKDFKPSRALLERGLTVLEIWEIEAERWMKANPGKTVSDFYKAKGRVKPWKDNILKNKAPRDNPKPRLQDPKKLEESRLARAFGEQKPGYNPNPGKTSKVWTDKAIFDGFVDWAKELDYSDAQINKYLSEVVAERDAWQKANVTIPNQEMKAAGIPATEQVTAAHGLAIGEGGIDSRRTVRQQLRRINSAEGADSQPPRAAQIAMGDPGLTAGDRMRNWKTDFLTWADKPENGGSGILPQRGDLTLEQEEDLIKYAKDPNVSDDFLAELERTPKSQRHKVKVPESVAADANAIRNMRAKGWTTGGFMKAASGMSKADAVLNLAGGNVVGGSLGLLMQTPTFQKQAGKLMKKVGLSLIPGVSLGSGALQAIGYASGGQWTKAGLSALSGVIGEVPGWGDAVSAGIELGLTADEIRQYRYNPEYQTPKKAKRKFGAKKLKEPTSVLRRTSKAIRSLT